MNLAFCVPILKVPFSKVMIYRECIWTAWLCQAKCFIWIKLFIGHNLKVLLQMQKLGLREFSVPCSGSQKWVGEEPIFDLPDSLILKKSS